MAMMRNKKSKNYYPDRKGKSKFQEFETVKEQ